MKKKIELIIAILALAGLAVFESRCAGTTGGNSISNPIAASISAQPTSATVTAGQTAVFSVTATGTPAPTYQWYQGATAISGAMSSSYSIPNTSVGMSGETFYVVVSNSAGTATSITVTLTVNAATATPSITQQPANATVAAGQTAVFSVTATGTPTPTYQWYQGTTAISGATSTSYSIPNTTTGMSGETFNVVVSNSAGTATSNTVTLTVNAVTANSVNVLTYHNDIETDRAKSQ